MEAEGSRRAREVRRSGRLSGAPRGPRIARVHPTHVHATVGVRAVQQPEKGGRVHRSIVTFIFTLFYTLFLVKKKSRTQARSLSCGPCRMGILLFGNNLLFGAGI